MSLKLDFLVAILLVSFEPSTEAHDIYSHLKDRLGNSCCDDQDCHPAPYRVTTTGVQMHVEGKWITIPNDTIQYRALPGDAGETAGGHWCGVVRNRYGGRGEYVTLCAILPPNSTAVFRPPFALREDRIQPVP
jgi:hypothetical protein